MELDQIVLVVSCVDTDKILNVIKIGVQHVSQVSC